LLRSQKAALLYFITVYMLIPLSAPIILGGVIQAYGKIDIVFSLLYYFTSPISMIIYSDYADIPSLNGYAISIAISALIIIISIESFRKLEYALEH